MTATPDPDGGVLEGIVEDLRKACGHDLRSYKRAPLMRCVRRRMKMVGATTLVQYRAMLSVRRAEILNLADAALNHTTTFYRDRDVWITLASRLGARVAEASPTNRIRVWSAGCSTGEEACSIAILFAELLGRRETVERVRIFATDIDENALTRARAGRFDARALAELPEPHWDAYFARSGSDHVFDTDMRSTIVFGRHDLLTDPPLPQLDLVLCRNTLLYLQPRAQSLVVSRFHGVLKEGGLFVVGTSEAGIVPRELYRSRETGDRIFERVEPSIPQAQRKLRPSSHRRALYEAALDRADAMLLVDHRGRIAFVSQGAIVQLGLSAADEGRGIEELIRSRRLSALTRPMRKLRDERVSIRLRNVVCRGARGVTRFDVVLRPLLGLNEELLGAEITLVEASADDRH